MRVWPVAPWVLITTSIAEGRPLHSSETSTGHPAVAHPVGTPQGEGLDQWRPRNRWVSPGAQDVE